MAKEYKGKIYPRDLYVVKDKNGTIHWYKSDPLRAQDRKAEEIDISREVVAFSGGASIANPTCVRLNVAYINRALDFAISQPENIRTGKMDGHFEDLTGRIVEIQNLPNGSTDYPLNGMLMDRKGNILGTATYNHHGECSDGIPDHDIMMFAGRAWQQANVAGAGADDDEFDDDGM